MICPNCKSLKTEFDEAYGFYKCLDCLHLWALDKDDPDYDDIPEDRPRSMKFSADEPDYVLVHKKALLLNTLALFYACKTISDNKDFSSEYCSALLGETARHTIKSKSESEIDEIVKSLIDHIDENPEGIYVLVSPPPEESQ